MISSTQAAVFFMASNIILRSVAFTAKPSRFSATHPGLINLKRYSGFPPRLFSSKLNKLHSTIEDQVESDSTATTSGYPFKEVEKKWQDYWDQHQTFKTPERTPGKIKKYVLDMFPYPSGAGLHVGHPEGYTGKCCLICLFQLMIYYQRYFTNKKIFT